MVLAMRTMNAKRIGCIVAVTLCCSQASALAAPGDLDPSFGGDGVVHTNLSSDRRGRDTAFGLAVQADG